MFQTWKFSIGSLFGFCLVVVIGSLVNPCVLSDTIENPVENEKIGKSSNIPSNGTAVAQTTVTVKLKVDGVQQQAFNDELGEQDDEWLGTLELPTSPPGYTWPTGGTAKVEVWRDGDEKVHVIIDIVN